MAGTISSLGIGSNVLTADVIDKLKANDESLIIKPIDNKITQNTQKTQALDLLDSLLTSFKANTSSLSNETLYQKRTVSGNNDGINVTALSGSAIQSFSISNTVMALKNVQESGSFSSETAKVSSGTGTMTVAIDGSNYNFDYTATTTLSDLKDSINNSAGSKVTASVLQTGTNDYRLVLTSKNTGVNQTISITDSVGGTLNNELKAYDSATNPNGIQEIQAAKDATFNYNGISITRSSNTIDDLIIGVSINLLQDNATSNISITQNTQAIADELQGLTTSYNTLMTQLDDMTLTDTVNKKVGIFNGDNTIKSIKREITKMLTSVTSDGNSLAQFGIGLDEKGTMSFTQSDFNTQLAANPTGLEAFFSGATDTKGNYTAGLFTNLDSKISYYTKTDGLMGTLTTGAKDDLKALNDNKTRSQALLDARYTTMTARFAQYDSIISNLNSQFSSLQQQINAMANQKN